MSGIVKSTEAADRVIMIDGCPLDCGRRTLEGAGISGFTHVRVTDLGYAKGETPPTQKTIERVASGACAAAGIPWGSPTPSDVAQGGPGRRPSRCCGG